MSSAVANDNDNKLETLS